jgi:O-antigen/teichoic acid export membrane protein
MPTLARDTTKQRAARDILLQVVVRVANLLLGALVTALVVRTLGQTGFGEWSTMFAVLGIIGYFTSFGMEGVALREAARDPDSEHEWIGAVMALRLMAILPVMLVSLVAVLLLERSQEMLIAGVILVVAMPFGGVGALGLLFELRVDNRVPMIELTVRSVLWGIAVYVIFRDQGDMVALAIAMVLTNAVGSIVQAVAALKLDARFPRPSRKYARQLLRLSLPVGISMLLIISYVRIDQLMVYLFAGTDEAGLYGAVYSLLDRAHFVPISVLTTLAPIMAAAWPGDRARLLRTARMTAELMLVASLGGLAFAIVASEPLVRLIFGEEFVAAAPALPVLGAAFIFISLGYVTGNLLLVLGKQHLALRVSVLGLIVNVCGNLILIPLVGFMGAAWMTLATEAVVFACGLWLILRTLDMGLPRPGRIARMVLAAGLLGGALEALSRADASLAVLAGVAAIGYPALLFGLRAVSVEDLRVVLGREALA